jgi:cell division protease FtsH
MSERLGPVNFDGEDGAVFLGRDLGSAPKHGASKAEEIDSEITRILREGYDRAKGLVLDKRIELDRIAESLLERETLDLVELKLLLEGKPLPPLPRPDVTPKVRRTSADKRSKSDLKVPFGEKGMPDPEPMPG